MTTATRNAIPMAYQKPRIPHAEVGYRVWHALNDEARGSNALARQLAGHPEPFDDLDADWLQPDRMASHDSISREHEQRAQDDRERVIGARYAAAALIRVGQRLRAYEETELAVQRLQRENDRPYLARVVSSERLGGIRAGIKALDAAWEELFTGDLDPLTPDAASEGEEGA